MSVLAEAVSFVAFGPVAVALLHGSVVVQVAVVAVAADCAFVDRPPVHHWSVVLLASDVVLAAATIVDSAVDLAAAAEWALAGEWFDCMSDRAIFPTPDCPSVSSCFVVASC